MKYDVANNQTRGAKRVLTAITGSFFNLLTQKPFTEISVGEICENADYPRATFYNYFDDKYDLLNYLLYTIALKIKVDEYEAVPTSERLPVFYDRLYNLFEEFSKQVEGIVSYNRTDDYFMSSLKIFMLSQIKLLCEEGVVGKTDVPLEMVAEHYSNTIYLVMEWKFVKGHHCTKEKSYEFLTKLLNGRL